MTKSILFLATFISAHLALATGGTYCTVDNDEIVIEVQLVNSRTPSLPVAQGGAFASIKDHLSTPWKFDAISDLSAWWVDSNQIKMAFYKEIETETELETGYLKIEVLKDEFGFEAHGVYTFSQGSKVVTSGPISCSYE